jgi:hypothetical protein
MTEAKKGRFRPIVPDDGKKAAEWLAWHSLFSLMPLLIAALVLPALKLPVSFVILAGDGQFALYAASAAGAAMYLATRFPPPVIPGRTYIMWLGVGCIITASIIYTVALSAPTQKDPIWVGKVSVATYVIGLAAAVWAFVSDLRAASPDPRRMRAQQDEAFEGQFRATGD